MDTDVRFGKSAGFSTMLVLSGATSLGEAAAIFAEDPTLTPDFVAANVAALLAAEDGAAS